MFLESAGRLSINDNNVKDIVKCRRLDIVLCVVSLNTLWCRRVCILEITFSNIQCFHYILGWILCLEQHTISAINANAILYMFFSTNKLNILFTQNWNSPQHSTIIRWFRYEPKTRSVKSSLVYIVWWCSYYTYLILDGFDKYTSSCVCNNACDLKRILTRPRN